MISDLRLRSNGGQADTGAGGWDSATITLDVQMHSITIQTFPVLGFRGDDRRLLCRVTAFHTDEPKCLVAK